MPWPAAGDAGPLLIDRDALELSHHFMWMGPDQIWSMAGAVRRHSRTAPVAWDAEDLRLLALVASNHPLIEDASARYYRRWRTRTAGANAAFLVARTVCYLPELVAEELRSRCGVGRLDARLRGVRAAAREFGWSAKTLRRFACRQVPFHPLVAAPVCEWLAQSARLSTSDSELVG